MIHCELNTDLSEIAKHNFEMLKADNITCYPKDGLEVLKDLNQKFDWIYIDPSRRNESKGKVFLLKDCLPDITILLEDYLKYSDNILIKTSPVYDISVGISELKFIKNIHIIALENEVKELLFEIQKTSELQDFKPWVRTVNLTSSKIEKFDFVWGQEVSPTYSELQKYLYEPNASEYDTKGCLDGWFDTSMPDMNDRNPLLITYLVQNAIWWIEYAGLDGIRVDTFPYNGKEGIANWTQRVMSEYPNFNIVGEAWLHDQAQLSFWQKDSKIAEIVGYNSHLPSVMDFTLHDAIMQAFNEDQQHWDNATVRFYDNFANDFLYPNINNILVFAANHDTQRIHTVFGGDVNKYKLAMTLILTVRGIPQIYYGDEIGMQGDKGKGDGDIRRDFPGGWPSDSQNAFTENGRTQEQKQYFDFTKKLLNWRKNQSVIHYGKTTHYIPENNVYVYFRHNETESVMVVLNNSDQPQTINTKRFKENIQNSTQAKDIISEKVISLTDTIQLPAKSSMILELKP